MTGGAGELGDGKREIGAYWRYVSLCSMCANEYKYKHQSMINVSVLVLGLLGEPPDTTFISAHRMVDQRGHHRHCGKRAARAVGIVQGG